MSLYVNNNGEILNAEFPTINSGNRGYLFGDGVFESIRIFNGKPINIQNHIKRLLSGAKALQIRCATFYNASFFEEKINELIEKSNITQGGRCRLSIDRVSGGTYFPISNESCYYIEVYPFEHNLFELNAKGLEVDIYREIKIQKNFLSNFKTKACINYVMAAIYARQNELDDVLISNDKGNILETSSCNVFVVSNGVLYTPGLDEGCLAGTMRMQVINLALKNGIKVYECSILPQNLLSADEIFITNSIRGINWIGGYRTKRFYNHLSKKLVAFLNEYWENTVN